MSRNGTQLDVPGSKPCTIRKLAACCPRCKVPLVGEFATDCGTPYNIRCPKCSYRLEPPAADTIDIAVLCPICRSTQKAARRPVTLEIDHIWCPACEERRRLGTKFS